MRVNIPKTFTDAYKTNTSSLWWSVMQWHCVSDFFFILKSFSSTLPCHCFVNVSLLSLLTLLCKSYILVVHCQRRQMMFTVGTLGGKQTSYSLLPVHLYLAWKVCICFRECFYKHERTPWLNISINKNKKSGRYCQN